MVPSHGFLVPFKDQVASKDNPYFQLFDCPLRKGHIFYNEHRSNIPKPIITGRMGHSIFEYLRRPTWDMVHTGMIPQYISFLNTEDGT